jgi:hypothetical protein
VEDIEDATLHELAIIIDEVSREEERQIKKAQK